MSTGTQAKNCSYTESDRDNCANALFKNVARLLEMSEPDEVVSQRCPKLSNVVCKPFQSATYDWFHLQKIRIRICRVQQNARFSFVWSRQSSVWARHEDMQNPFCFICYKTSTRPCCLDVCVCVWYLETCYFRSVFCTYVAEFNPKLMLRLARLGRECFAVQSLSNCTYTKVQSSEIARNIVQQAIGMSCHLCCREARCWASSHKVHVKRAAATTYEVLRPHSTSRAFSRSRHIPRHCRHRV
jgi:hypothetical protein